jgi:DNA helicase HerA-like ATPase
MSTNEYGGKFFIGREYDLKSGKTLEKSTLYDPDDLTTHGVVVGMTGSGKTGLCIDILEEAALNGIPALMIDPKGDIANLLLHFPDLRPEDFAPWVDPDIARREGKSIEQMASETASLWQKGLACLYTRIECRTSCEHPRFS